MNNLAYYYESQENNYDPMKKYYLMAIQQNFKFSMHNLAHYYENIEKNYDLMKKYYLMGIDNDYQTKNLLIEKLEFYIKYIDKIKRKQIIDTISYIIKIKLNKEDEKKFIDIIMGFKFEIEDNIPFIVRILIESIKYKLDIAKLHFEYSLEGKGYKEAEEDFYNKII
jgi:hypothetical protein